MNDDELFVSMAALLLGFTILALGVMYAVAVLR